MKKIRQTMSSPTTTPSPRDNSEVRKAQNRAAQRAFRIRKELRLKELEQSLNDLQQSKDKLVQHLNKQIEDLKERLLKSELENVFLRTQLGFNNNPCLASNNLWLASSSSSSSSSAATISNGNVPSGYPNAPMSNDYNLLSVNPLKNGKSFVDGFMTTNNLSNTLSVPEIGTTLFNRNGAGNNSNGAAPLGGGGGGGGGIITEKRRCTEKSALKKRIEQMCVYYYQQLKQKPDRIPLYRASAESVNCFASRYGEIILAAKAICQERGKDDPLTTVFMDHEFVLSLFILVPYCCVQKSSTPMYRDPRIAFLQCEVMRQNLQLYPDSYSVDAMFDFFEKHVKRHGPPQFLFSWELNDEFYDTFPDLVDDVCKARERLRSEIHRMTARILTRDVIIYG